MHYPRLEGWARDGSHEASLMSNVYKYSQCTLTATAIVEDQMCFPSTIKDPISVSIFKPELPEKPRGRYLQGLYDIYHRNTSHEDISSAATSNRA